MLVKQRNKLFNLTIPRSLKIVYVWGKGLGIFANKQFSKGDTVIHFRAELVPVSKASPEAVQFTESEYIDTKWLVAEAFINHSCAPNTKLDTVGFCYVAIKTIGKDEEITYNYLTTEYDLKEKNADFRCACGARNCIGQIRGFRYLNRLQQLKLKSYLSPFLLRKLS